MNSNSYPRALKSITEIQKKKDNFVTRLLESNMINVTTLYPY